MSDLCTGSAGDDDELTEGLQARKRNWELRNGSGLREK